jgi:hypothetical protein
VLQYLHYNWECSSRKKLHTVQCTVPIIWYLQIHTSWKDLTYYDQCCGSMTFWRGSGSGSADPCLWLMDPDPDPAIFVIVLQDASKKTNFLHNFSAYYFLKTHLHHFSKINSQKESQNSRNQGVSYYFCMMIEGSGSVSGRPENMWIRWIRIRIRIRIRNTAYDNLFVFLILKTKVRTLVADSICCTKIYLHKKKLLLTWIWSIYCKSGRKVLVHT